MDDLEARLNQLMGIETIDDYPIEPIYDRTPEESVEHFQESVRRLNRLRDLERNTYDDDGVEFDEYGREILPPWMIVSYDYRDDLQPEEYIPISRMKTKKKRYIKKKRRPIKLLRDKKKTFKKKIGGYFNYPIIY